MCNVTDCISHTLDAVAELSAPSIHIHKDLHSAYSLSERKPYSFFKNAGRVLFIIIRLLLFSLSLGFSQKFQPNEDTATPPSGTPNAHCQHPPAPLIPPLSIPHSFALCSVRRRPFVPASLWGPGRVSMVTQRVSEREGGLTDGDFLFQLHDTSTKRAVLKDREAGEGRWGGGPSGVRNRGQCNLHSAVCL